MAPELREIVWKLFLEFPGSIYITSVSPIPGIGYFCPSVHQWGGRAALTVNRESRDYALPLFATINRPFPFGGPPILFNFEIDQIIFARPFDLYKFHHEARDDAREIKHVAVRQVNWNDDDEDDLTYNAMSYIGRHAKLHTVTLYINKEYRKMWSNKVFRDNFETELEGFGKWWRKQAQGKARGAAGDYSSPEPTDFPETPTNTNFIYLDEED